MISTECSVYVKFCFVVKEENFELKFSVYEVIIIGQGVRVRNMFEGSCLNG